MLCFFQKSYVPCYTEVLVTNKEERIIVILQNNLIQPLPDFDHRVGVQLAVF